MFLQYNIIRILFISPSILCLTYSKICIKQVYTEGRLIVEFTFDDMMRIRSWHFAVRNHRELIPRNILAMQDPGMVESLSKNITRQGLTNTTLNYLRVIAIFWYLVDNIILIANTNTIWNYFYQNVIGHRSIFEIKNWLIDENAFQWLVGIKKNTW